MLVEIAAPSIPNLLINMMPKQKFIINPKKKEKATWFDKFCLCKINSEPKKSEQIKLLNISTINTLFIFLKLSGKILSIKNSKK